jgi:hypothetical protein
MLLLIYYKLDPPGILSVILADGLRPVGKTICNGLSSLIDAAEIFFVGRTIWRRQIQ